MRPNDQRRGRVVIARAIHEVNRAYCIALGDDSQLPWDYAPEWQRESAIVGVDRVVDILNAGGVPNPADSHQSWRTHKLRDGWKYGPIKDADRKEHPCMVDYDDLAPADRAKDALFIGIVAALRAALVAAGVPCPDLVNTNGGAL